MTECLERAERALGLVSGDEAEVVVTTEHSGFARYAGKEVPQPTLIDNASVQLRLIRDGRAGVAPTNRPDDEGLAELVRRATDVVVSAGPDPDLPPLAPPAEFPDVRGYDEETAELGADDQARLAAAAIAASGDYGLYGYFTSGVVELAIASTTGLRASQRTTDANWLALAAVDGASGYATRTSWRVGDVTPKLPGRLRRLRGRATRRRRRPRSTAPSSSRTRSPSSSTTAFDMFNGLALLEEPATSQAGSASARSTRRSRWPTTR